MNKSLKSWIGGIIFQEISDLCIILRLTTEEPKKGYFSLPYIKMQDNTLLKLQRDSITFLPDW